MAHPAYSAYLLPASVQPGFNVSKSIRNSRISLPAWNSDIYATPLLESHTAGYDVRDPTHIDGEFGRRSADWGFPIEPSKTRLISVEASRISLMSERWSNSSKPYSSPGAVTPFLMISEISAKHCLVRDAEWSCGSARFLSGM